MARAGSFACMHVPTAMINAEKLVDPDEKKLRQEIERAFTATVKPSDKSKFIRDPLMKPNAELLAKIKI